MQFPSFFRTARNSFHSVCIFDENAAREALSKLIFFKKLDANSNLFPSKISAFSLHGNKVRAINKVTRI